MRFLFLSNFFPRRRPAQAQTRPARTIWRLQYTVSARVFLGMQRSGTRQTLCALVRQRGNGEEMRLAVAAIAWCGERIKVSSLFSNQFER